MRIPAPVPFPLSAFKVCTENPVGLMLLSFSLSFQYFAVIQSKSCLFGLTSWSCFESDTVVVGGSSASKTCLQFAFSNWVGKGKYLLCSLLDLFAG